jgi:chromosome segregation ATPase
MCLFGKKFLFILVLLFLFSPLVFSQPIDTSDRQMLIYESELLKLLSNTIQLQKLVEQQKIQLENSTLNSKRQNEQSEALMELSFSYQSQIKNLQSDLMTLEVQMKASQLDLSTLQGQMQTAQQSYKSLYESFLTYQKEVEKQIGKLKTEKAIAGGLAIAGWIAAVIATIAWFLEKF